jgi:hypothetical protein
MHLINSVENRRAGDIDALQLPQHGDAIKRPGVRASQARTGSDVSMKGRPRRRHGRARKHRRARALRERHTHQALRRRCRNRSTRIPQGFTCDDKVGVANELTLATTAPCRRAPQMAHHGAAGLLEFTGALARDRSEIRLPRQLGVCGIDGNLVEWRVFVHVRQHGHVELALDALEHAQAALQTEPAKGGQRRPIGLVEGGLEQEWARARGDVVSVSEHNAALDHTRTGDENSGVAATSTRQPMRSARNGTL